MKRKLKIRIGAFALAVIMGLLIMFMWESQGIEYGNEIDAIKKDVLKQQRELDSICTLKQKKIDSLTLIQNTEQKKADSVRVIRKFEEKQVERLRESRAYLQKMPTQEEIKFN